jgi:uncharacterized membrane protein
VSVPAPVAQCAVVPRWVSLSSMLLSLAGVAVAAYLSYEHFTASSTLACPDTGAINCVKVTSSSYAAIAGVPVAVLGLVFFVAMTLLCLPGAWAATGQSGAALRRVRLVGAIVGIVFVLYLIWAELFAIDAICLWCTAVHVLTIALFAVVAFGTAATTS